MDPVAQKLMNKFGGLFVSEIKPRSNVTAPTDQANTDYYKVRCSCQDPLDFDATTNYCAGITQCVYIFGGLTDVGGFDSFRPLVRIDNTPKRKPPIMNLRKSKSYGMKQTP